MISETDIDAVAAFAGREGPSEATVAALRKAWPDYHFTWCLDDDVSAAAKPVRTASGFNLYLVAGAGGCIGFTGNREGATGLVIAACDDD